jgi:hypothetical protein
MVEKPGSSARKSPLPLRLIVFQLVVASTVFTSILDVAVRQIVAREITRVLASGRRAALVRLRRE